MNLQDPKQKAAAMEAFVVQYPQSAAKANALEEILEAYARTGDEANEIGTADRMLQVEPDNLRVVALLTFFARGCVEQYPVHPVTDASKELLDLGQKGLASLPEWLKTQAPWPPDAARLRDEMTTIFAGAAGRGALQNEDYRSARTFYEQALAINPLHVRNLYELALADLQMNPVDPNGFWYCGKVMSLLPLLHNDASTEAFSGYCKMQWQAHGGKPKEWKQLVSSTEKDAKPPKDFAQSGLLAELSLSPATTPFVANGFLEKWVQPSSKGPDSKGPNPMYGLLPPSGVAGGSASAPMSRLLLPGAGAGGSGSANASGAAISPPESISAPPPAYPKTGAKIEGIEKLSILVTSGGGVDDIRVVKSLGLAFDEEAIAAVKQWKFKPATKDGKPVAQRVTIEINFQP
jgi:TonB family protein